MSRVMSKNVWRAVFGLGLASLLAVACGGGEPPGECSVDADCDSGEVCEPGVAGGPTVCVAGCHEDNQCAAGETCERVVCVTTPCPGHCSGPSGCESDGDCTFGEVCEPSGPSCGPPVCVPGCRNDDGCEQGLVCNVVVCVTCPCPGQCIEG